MEFPREGDVIDRFEVESVSVQHIAVEKLKRYEYPTEIAAKGKGRNNIDSARS